MRRLLSGGLGCGNRVQERALESGVEIARDTTGVALGAPVRPFQAAVGGTDRLIYEQDELAGKSVTLRDRVEALAHGIEEVRRHAQDDARLLGGLAQAIDHHGLELGERL